MRTLTAVCPVCEAETTVEIEESDLADLELNHTVVCEECGIESEFEFDMETQELVVVDDDEDDDEEEDEPEETDAAEEE